MPVGGKYQIGMKLTGKKAASVKAGSTNGKAATETRLKNGNYLVTGKGTGTAYMRPSLTQKKAVRSIRGRLPLGQIRLEIWYRANIITLTIRITAEAVCLNRKIRWSSNIYNKSFYCCIDRKQNEKNKIFPVLK
jgi:hypothetical protein